jgi:hypothetical protein
MSILYVGIDLAENAFAVHGVNEAGAAELRQPKVTRANAKPAAEGSRNRWRLLE